MRGKDIKENLIHDAGAYARCSYCGIYSDVSGTIYNELKCDCGKTKGWSGSFKSPNKNSKWINAR